MKLFLLSLWAFANIQVHALYEANSKVIQLGEKDFKDKVLKGDELWLVEFYAPWCGHCRNLAPEWEKAAAALRGVVKVAAVDATVHQSLASKFQVQGYPTVKVFGADKKTPLDFNGRTSDAIISEAMKQLGAMVKDRKKGKGGSSSGSSSGGSKSSSSGGSSSGGSKSGSSDVVELTEANFNALVMESTDHWIVEFFAPWCGHCKNLAPEYETAATQLKGSVKLGAIDATVHQSLASRYDVKGYPTLKLFPAGKKGKPVDYQGPREAPGIVEYALRTLDEAGVPVTINQLTSSEIFSDACSQKGKICAILFVPHILDSGAKTRNSYLDTLAELAKSFRGKPFTFIWAEAGAHSQLEEAIGLGINYPSLAVLSTDKKVFAVHRLSWSKKNLNLFLNGVLSGSERTLKMSTAPTVSRSLTWDGKDAEAVQEDIPLDQLFGDD